MNGLLKYVAESHRPQRLGRRLPHPPFEESRPREPRPGGAWLILTANPWAGRVRIEPEAVNCPHVAIAAFHEVEEDKPDDNGDTILNQTKHNPHREAPKAHVGKHPPAVR